MTSAPRITATLFTDPGCPFGYSATAWLRTLEWCYGDQIDWHLVMVGLAESSAEYDAKGFTPAMAAFNVDFRVRYGMPFVVAPKPRNAGTSEACRFIIAGSIAYPGSEWLLTRELQFANFTDPEVLLDDPQGFVPVLERSPRIDGIDLHALATRIDDEDVRAEYERQRAATRSAAGTAGALQGKTSGSGEDERFSAPTVIFENADGVRIDVTGFQPIEAHDVAIANLDPTLERRGPAETVGEALAAFPGGLTTAQVAWIRRAGNDPVDRDGTERDLVKAVAAGEVRRDQLGSDAVWHIA